MGRNILVTGASGFIGSALCATLSREHRIVGLHRRPLSEKLKHAAPSVTWAVGDVADPDALALIFRRSAVRGHPIDYLIHLAAFTGFGHNWNLEYTRTNVAGTRNVIEAAGAAGARRILFAGSIAALEPPGSGAVLTEASEPNGRVAYARSKAVGERICRENAARLPAVVLRLGGVFTDWCELPPLFSLIRLWHRPVLGRMIPGKGHTGFPYIHRRDVVALVRRIIEKDDDLGRFEVMFGSPAGATDHRTLFPAIRRACHPGFSTTPVHVPLPLARLVLHLKYAVNTLKGKNTYERAWMLDYADRPLRVNTDRTRKRLGWSPDPGLDIQTRIPVLILRFKTCPDLWMIRNISRNDQNYMFDPDC